jgi:hypothetical protein
MLKFSSCSSNSFVVADVFKALICFDVASAQLLCDDAIVGHLVECVAEHVRTRGQNVPTVNVLEVRMRCSPFAPLRRFLLGP